MKQLDIILKGPTLAVGDIHGTIPSLPLEDLPRNSNLIFLGDIGVGFPNDIVFKLSKHYKNHNVFLLRGNHDDPSYWEHAPYRVSKNVTFLSDGYININGEYYLCIGGGISVDKNYRHRIEDMTWWKDENVSYTIPNRCKRIKGILSHSCFTPPTILKYKFNWNDPDGSLQLDIQKENELWFDIHKRFKPKEWYHGHFHVHETYNKGKTNIHSLDINELQMISNSK